MENPKQNYNLEGKVKAVIAFGIASIGCSFYFARDTFNYVAEKIKNESCKKEYSLKPSSLAENFNSMYNKVMKDLEANL